MTTKLVRKNGFKISHQPIGARHKNHDQLSSRSPSTKITNRKPTSDCGSQVTRENQFLQIYHQILTIKSMHKKPQKKKQFFTSDSWLWPCGLANLAWKIAPKPLRKWKRGHNSHMNWNIIGTFPNSNGHASANLSKPSFSLTAHVFYIYRKDLDDCRVSSAMKDWEG